MYVCKRSSDLPSESHDICVIPGCLLTVILYMVQSADNKMRSPRVRHITRRHHSPTSLIDLVCSLPSNVVNECRRLVRLSPLILSYLHHLLKVPCRHSPMVTLFCDPYTTMY